MTAVIDYNVKYPPMTLVQQRLESAELQDIEGEVHRQIQSLKIDDRLRDNRRIAITAGSRGICNAARIIRALSDYIKKCGGRPFIVPAMGSHGGAIAEGQAELLSHYGITEEAMGCPVCASMDVVLLGTTEHGLPVFFDRLAYEADGVIVCNRVKPHTDFAAPNESGLVKMLSIGLGKQKGAEALHRNGLAESIPAAAKMILEKAPIVAGLAIVENSLDRTYCIKAVRPERFIEEDARLLCLAREMVPKLPMEELDVLIVKEIGKEYSGTGMDTKVIGRIRVPGVPEPESPRIQTIVVLRLSANSHGNASGIGLADITTQSLVDTIDRETMYVNILTTTYLERGKIPVYFPTERDAMAYALAISSHAETEKARIAIVENTLHLDRLLISPTALASCQNLQILKRNVEVSFDESGRLL